MNIEIIFVHCSLPSGPEGIRTPDLLSAIEARSQLRYRPKFKANRILPDAFRNVNAKYSIKLKSVIVYEHINLLRAMHADREGHFNVCGAGGSRDEDRCSFIPDQIHCIRHG